MQAEILPSKIAEHFLKGHEPRSKLVQPVMFFGTREVAWIPSALVQPWQAGLSSLQKCKNKRLLASIKQVCAHEFCSKAVGF